MLIIKPHATRGQSLIISYFIPHSAVAALILGTKQKLFLSLEIRYPSIVSKKNKNSIMWRIHELNKQQLNCFSKLVMLPQRWSMKYFIRTEFFSVAHSCSIWDLLIATTTVTKTTWAYKQYLMKANKTKFQINNLL